MSYETPTHAYHGTSAKHLQSILRFGICPRGGKPSQWADYPSIPEHVYLSVAYPFYFGMCVGAGEGPILVLEVSLRGIEKDLYPDEDWLAQLVEHESPSMSLKAAQQYAMNAIDDNRELWPNSANEIGNLAHHGPVPPQNITRLVLFEPEKRPEISMSILDPSISLLNYKFMGWHYRHFVSWMFGDEPELPQLKWCEQGMVPALQNGGYREFWEAQSADRTGIEVRQKP